MKRVRNVFQVLCILATMLAFTNCQNETVTENQQTEALQKEFPFKSSVLTKQDIATNTKLHNQMKRVTGIQNGELSKSVYNAVYDFTVYTEVVNLVESIESNKHSYTFPIQRGNNTGNSLENLVFSYDETIDDYTASIVTYNFSASQKQEFLQNKHVSTAYDISFEAVSVDAGAILNKNTGLPCTTTFTVYHVTPDTGETFVQSSNTQHNECQHEDADGNTQCETYTEVYVNCPDGSNGDGLGTTDNSGNTGDPNTTGGSGNNNSNTIPPNTNEKPEVITTPISIEESQRITEELNQALGEENWEFDESVPDDAPNFDSIEELQAYLQSLVDDATTSLESSQMVFGQENIRRDVLRIHFSSFPQADIVSRVKLVQPATDVALDVDDFLDVRTNLDGNNTYFEWTQLDTQNPSDPDGPTMHILPNITTIAVDIDGEMQIGLRLYGNPLRSRKLLTITLNYDYVTSELDAEHSGWFFTD